MADVDWTTELRRGWATLDTPMGDGISTMAVADTATGAVRIAIDGSGRRHLLVPISEDDRPTLLKRDGPLTMEMTKLAFSGPTVEFVDVACDGVEFFEPFTDLCSALLEVVTDADQPAVQTTKMVQKWRDFLRAHDARRMRRQAELGLFGELWTLRVLVNEGLRDLETWTGPANASQDFTFRDGWLEIKTRGTEELVHIHGLEQLDDSAGRTGHLIVIDAAEDGDGESIGDLLAEIDAELGNADVTEIAKSQGWRPHDEPNRWAVTGAWTAAASSIPRLIPSAVANLDRRVQNVTYTIEMTAILEVAHEGLDGIVGAYRMVRDQ